MVALGRIAAGANLGARADLSLTTLFVAVAAPATAIVLRHATPPNTLRVRAVVITLAARPASEVKRLPVAVNAVKLEILPAAVVGARIVGAVPRARSARAAFSRRAARTVHAPAVAVIRTRPNPRHAVVRRRATGPRFHEAADRALAATGAAQGAVSRCRRSSRAAKRRRRGDSAGTACARCATCTAGRDAVVMPRRQFFVRASADPATANRQNHQNSNNDRPTNNGRADEACDRHHALNSKPRALGPACRQGFERGPIARLRRVTMTLWSG